MDVKIVVRLHEEGEKATVQCLCNGIVECQRVVSCRRMTNKADWSIPENYLAAGVQFLAAGVSGILSKVPVEDDVPDLIAEALRIAHGKGSC